METIYGHGETGKALQLKWNVAVTDFVVDPVNPDEHGTSSPTPVWPTSGELQDCTHPPLKTP